MIALDTTTLVDLFFGSKKAEAYFKHVREQGGIISAVSLAEVTYVLKRDLSEEEADEAINILIEYPSLNIANVTPEIAVFAGAVRSKYYHRTHKPLSYNDAIVIATAVKHNASKIITKDADFKEIEEISIEAY